MTVLHARAPALAPGLELLGELRDSGYHDAPSIVRRADGQIVQVTPLLYSLLEAVDGERDVPELAEELSRRCGKMVAPSDVEFLIGEKLAPLGLVCGPDGAPPPAKKPVPLLALRCKVVVSNPEVTRRITSPFAALFRRAIVVPVLLAFAVTTWWVLFRHGLASGTRQAFDSPGLLLGAFLLVVVSAGWHEFGHAAACRAAGATPGAMGAGLYIVWPAFYTDVDDSRRLSRWGRLVVDLGGLYFNAIAAVAVMALWLVVRVDALLLVVAAQLLLMLRQLPPVIRADGYHILSDLVGVPDLFQHIKPTLAGMLPWHRRRPQPLRPWARWTVRAWVLLVVPLLLWMFVLAVLFLPRLAATAWLGAQQQARAITGASADADILGMAAGVLKMAALVLPVAASTFMIWRVVRRGWRGVWRRTEGRPAARRALVLLTAVVLAALAVAWWPSGQYRPVRADERLTLQHLVSRRPLVKPTAKGIPGVRPVTGYALVPRNADAPAMLVVPGDDGAQAILTGGPGVPSGAGAVQAIPTEGSRAGVAFPFKLPAAPGPGDNQALAANATDGSVVYDVAVALVWVKDGSPVLNRNEAYALASCSYCTTVAVAFQVVLVVGHTDVVAPVNLAMALNGGCLECQTAALAVQLVVTLREMPTEDLQKQIEAAMAKLDNLRSFPDPYAAIKQVEEEIVNLLADADLIDGVESQTSTTSSSGTAATTSTTVAGSTSPTTTTASTTTTKAPPTTAGEPGSATETSTTTNSTTTSTTIHSTTTTTSTTATTTTSTSATTTT